jgi:phosphoribosylpyrophosphate synthetase
VTSHLDITLGRNINSRFNDGEIEIQLLEPVRDQNIFILKSFENKNINDGIM